MRDVTFAPSAPLRKKGAKHRKLGVTGKLRGHSVQCAVTARNRSGATTAASGALSV